MLTATYSIVAMMVEWQSAHCSVAELEQNISSRTPNQARTDPAVLERTVQQLEQLDDAPHSRKLERYVVPALKKFTDEVTPLLAELESLKARGLALLRSMRERARSLVEQGIADVEEVCRSARLYCSNFYQRLDREERLLQLAQRVIPPEEWFSIAADFLADDAQHGRRRRGERIAAADFDRLAARAG